VIQVGCVHTESNGEAPREVGVLGE